MYAANASFTCCAERSAPPSAARDASSRDDGSDHSGERPDPPRKAGALLTSTTPAHSFGRNDADDTHWGASEQVVGCAQRSLRRWATTRWGSTRSCRAGSPSPSAARNRTPAAARSRRCRPGPPPAAARSRPARAPNVLLAPRSSRRDCQPSCRRDPRPLRRFRSRRSG